MIGAKKGFPNFNEFSYETASQITRRVDIDKGAVGNTPRQYVATNEAFQVGVSNVIGIEAWNSYATPYPRDISVTMVDDLRMYLTVTNTGNTNPVLTLPLSMPGQFVVGFANQLVPKGTWAGFPNNGNPSSEALSFRTVNTNIVFIPDLAYIRATQSLVSTNAFSGFEPVPKFGDPVPHFVLTVSNRVRCFMLDQDTKRVVDYVQLDSLNSTRDLTAELLTNDTLGVWNTNFDPVTKVPIGIIRQIGISKGDTTVTLSQWNNAQIHQSDQTSKDSAISGFNDWYNGNIPPDPNDLVRVAPFTPTAKFVQSWTWQVNDPLVHYTQQDLLDTNFNRGSLTTIAPPNNASLASSNSILPNIGKLNLRYHPWNFNRNTTGDPGLTDLFYKDPLAGVSVGSSDSWDFSTNVSGYAAYPNVGWLGRVHRGTPWQTIYLKSTTKTNLDKWRQWTGNTNLWKVSGNIVADADFMQPIADWQLVDLFATAPNDNAARGRLSINQTNFAAWAAIFNGVIALTNGSTGVLPWVVDTSGNEASLPYLITNINLWRAKNTAAGVFTNLGDILAVPQLTVLSPFINTNAVTSDAVYERLPQQVLGLLKVGQPRYVIYAYGQSLKPADHSLVTSGSYFGLCTNYQITGEVATRTVVRIDNAPIAGSTKTFQPRAVVESFNVIPPE